MRDLIRRDQQRAESIRHLQALIDEGIASGVSDKTMDEIFEEAMRQAAEAGSLNA